MDEAAVEPAGEQITGVAACGRTLLLSGGMQELFELKDCKIFSTGSPSLKRASMVVAYISLPARSASTTAAKLLVTLVWRRLCKLNRSALETP